MKDSESNIFAREVVANGWAVTGPIISAADIQALRADVAFLVSAGRGGARNLLELPRVCQLATAPRVRELACAVLGDTCFVVRALMFDKTPDANWKVIWHQDLTIATARRVEVEGYGPWTEKAGVSHTQPPVAVLESMLAVRIHLDACTRENGPVRVLEGSHREGRLSSEEIANRRASFPERECVVQEGGVLAFRPLLLHASAPARMPVHRRVIHFEFAAEELPAPLAWHQRVA